ncbi:efflux RND transporter periplasmic adaptor subunit [Aliiglaciecola sp. 3_MG-2023]|uniref:efflux RND transporter periplasmic adaptor subunit n=1 Tax=Aliiglaciecola sp. 3_MG-2023 TaxID=3062644 RepID=UPI0026E1A2B8|nr:efflux RND transporter periplasmic adaptor subunit [Aliiglaciecola sp. 3_MG-2023]MDO6694130.1 efflux RND transporter periplasmic adaptor subunit [Aliiglaciecola sp. 3_MG-2023]
MKYIITLLLPAILLCTNLLSFSASGQQFGAKGPTEVIVERVHLDSQKSSVEAVGSAEAVKSVDIFPATADKVVSVNFVPGQKVTQGQVLLELDSRRQKAALQRAKIQLADATRNLQRLEQSRSKGAVTESALDVASTAKELAKMDVIDAEIELQDRRVIAPFTGYVGLTDVEVGDRITEQTLITTLDDRSQLFINFRAPESAASTLGQNSSVTVQPWTHRDVTLDAKIAQLDSRISDSDRTILARAILDNQQDKYRPGMSFRVNISVLGQTFPIIPESGLSWGATGAYIWKMVDGKAQKIEVQIKQRMRGYLLVEGDISEGEQLIVEGIQRLRPGQAVEVRTVESE